MNFPIPSGMGPRGPGFQNFFSSEASRRFVRILRGAAIQICPAAVGFGKGPLIGAIRLIYVPRNFTFSSRVLVMRVFSAERVSLSDCRKSAMFDLSSRASDLVPHTPTSQSSA